MLFAHVFLVLSAPLYAQTVPQTLPAPNARLGVEFSDLTTIRELNDGRVLLFDRREERLMVADFATGSVRDVARKGQGPAEFEAVFALSPLAGDTTIAADMTRRWLILVGDSVVRKGFGATSVYVVVTDNDGIQRLRRHPMYASPRP